MTENGLVEESLKKTRELYKLALDVHSLYKGMVQMMPKCPIRSPDDFAVLYTPGVTASCKKIEEEPEQVWEQTNRGNCVAIVSDCTRVLGLGDIGPEAGLPVMEGKALLFKYLGGVDAFPICLRTKDADEIVRFCELIEPTVGGVNLEDIEKPKCFYVNEKAREKCRIPVWHDDQQGTATVILAGLINALKLVGKKRGEALITLFGSGAANIRTAFVLFHAGFNPGNILMVDTKGIISADRADVEEGKEELC